MFLGDFRRSQTVRFQWNTFNSSGASITRATNGTISVYKDSGTTQVTTGVTDTEDFDALTGVHDCTIVTTDAFYIPGAEYSVILSAATIDGQTVNAVLAQFSIENRFNGEIRKATAQGGAASSITLDAGASAIDDYYTGGSVFIESNTGALQARGITDYVGSTKVATIDRSWVTNPDSTSIFRLYPGSLPSTIQELVDAIGGRTVAEPSAAPTWPFSYDEFIAWMGAMSRNKITQTATTQTLRNDADSATIATSAVSDDATTFTRAEWA